MSGNSYSIIDGQQQVLRSELAFKACLIILCFLPALLGGMTLSLMLLALGLAVLVWRNPQEAGGVGILYLFACMVLLPSSSRMDVDAVPWEMQYWAIGSLIITASAVARVGLRRTFMVPRSAKVFLLVGLAATLYAVTHGVAMSDALKQLYGVVLLVVYCGIAIQVGDQELLLRRIRTYGVVCAIGFVVYYVAVFPQYGIHKEMSAVSGPAYLMAILLCITGAERKKLSWILLGLTLLLVPTLNLQRSAILVFLVAALIAFAMSAKSRILRFLCWSSVVLMALPALWPPAAKAAIDEVRKISIVENVVPESGLDAGTLYERGLQVVAAIDTLQAHPWFGDGLGSELGIDSPFGQGHFEHAFVDSGWAFLFQKMGLLGAAAFLWFLVTVLRRISRRFVAISACLLAAAVVAMFSQPVFFHFTSSPLIGTAAGLLLAQTQTKPSGGSVAPGLARVSA